MAKRRSETNVHESFADVALMMLGVFVFLLVMLLITARVSEQRELPKLKEQVRTLQEQLEFRPG